MSIPCMVCFMEKSEVSIRSCCSGIFCQECLRAHVEAKIEEAIVKIVCPLGNCDSLVSEDEITSIVSEEVLEKYERFKLDLEQNPHIKTCPGCSRIYQHGKLKLNVESAEDHDDEQKETIQEDLKVICSRCQLVWCFACQAPWHYGLTCKEFCKGDKSLKIWAKNRGQPIRNACRCPKCRVFIQKSSGCDHMSCSRCHTEFCYRCGGRYYHVKLLGNHYDRFSVLGCKYNFKPEQPAQRIAVRGAILGGQIMATPVLAGLFVSAACVLLGVGVVAAPFYGSYMLVKRQRTKAKKQARKNMSRR